MRKIIKFPRRLASDFEGFNFLSFLNSELKNVEFEQIIFDFSQTSWFEANLCAVLGALINKSQKNLNEIEILHLQPKQRDILSKNHFLASFGGEIITDTNDTTIKYRRNKLEDDKLIKEFLDKELITKPDFPKLSDKAKAEIIRSIFEIYSNAVIHGDSKFVYSCGQFYPQKSPPRIDFTIVDIGKTIKRNVNMFLEKDYSGIDAILWALKDNNTTKPKEKKIPGGLGLKIITDFTRLNQGKIQIVSSDGYWELNKGIEKSYTLDYIFPGTIVNLEFNLNDASFYYLDNETPTEIIF